MGNCLGIKQKKIRLYKYIYQHAKTPMAVKDVCLRWIGPELLASSNARLTTVQNRLRVVNNEIALQTGKKEGLYKTEINFVRAIRRTNPSGWKKLYESRVETHVEPVVLPELLSIELRIAAKRKEQKKLRRDERNYANQIQNIEDIMQRINSENETTDTEWLFATINNEFTVSGSVEGVEQRRYQDMQAASEDQEGETEGDGVSAEKKMLAEFVKAIMNSSSAVSENVEIAEDNDDILLSVPRTGLTNNVN